MKFLSKLLGGGASNLIDSVSNVVDKFSLSKEEKQEFQLEVQEKLMQIDRLAQETYQKEVQTRSDIIKAEMAQGDNYTKRARPTIVYVGLIFIFIVHVIIPIIAFFTKFEYSPEKLGLPDEFWWAWGTVVSVYGVGRSAEKFGVANKLTQFATGSGASKVGKLASDFINDKNAVG